MEKWIGIGIFFLTVIAIYGSYLLAHRLYKPEQRKIHRRLRAFGERIEAVGIVKTRKLSEMPWLNRFLATASFVPRLERLHSQAAAPQPLGVFVMFTVLLFFGGLFMAAAMRMHFLASVLPSLLLAAIPLLYLVRSRKKRLAKFERQLPEALELISRALKAGHAFTGGLRMVADEFSDPVGVEFGKTVDEINFGMSVPDALMNLTQRIDCEDLKFFVVSVIVQRETGGNLSEILEGLGRLIRERFKFNGRVRVLTAEGRMSANVLVAMPFFVVAMLSVLNPDYIKVLFSDPMGTYLIVLAVGMMSIGTIVIKKLVALRA